MSTGEIVALPDIGDFSDVEVIEILVSVGDSIAIEDSILTLESDKATMEVPSTIAGKITEVLISIGDKISQGDPLLRIDSEGAVEETDQDESTASDAEQPAKVESPPIDKEVETVQIEQPYAEEESATQNTYVPLVPAPSGPLPPPVEKSKIAMSYASPGTRRFARELGADLSLIRGTANKGRITKEDVKRFVKQTLQSKDTPTGGVVYGPPPIPEVDFSRFGAIELKSLSKIKRITGDRLHRSWLDIPHVTHHDESDITELENFRKSLGNELMDSGVRITVLAFICKAVVATLKEFPTFNSSLSPDNQSLILKKYFNLGIAVDTANGLVVPVVKGVENFGIKDFAIELQAAGEKARTGRLTPSDFEGGCFTISSLGGIGGRFFTPIINPPEVAILGVSRHHKVLVPGSSSIDTRLMLPLSLSYDHRVIDGAEAARFTAYLARLLEDPRRILL